MYFVGKFDKGVEKVKLLFLHHTAASVLEEIQGQLSLLDFLAFVRSPPPR
jgi:hypothetical protein